MTSTESFDAVVLSAVKPAEHSLAPRHGGRSVAVIEDCYIGGSCPNIACLPSKNIIHNAAIAHNVWTASRFGSHVGSFAVSMAEVQTRKRAMVEGLIATHQARFKASGAELMMDRGKFVGERTIDVALNGAGTRVMRGDGRDFRLLAP